MRMYFASLFLLATASAKPADTVRQSLISASDRWFFWLVISSLVVGIGVCLEAPEATIALRRWYLHWRKGSAPPENERSLAIPASYVGLLLVILGVIGEGAFESLSSTTETALRAHDEQILAATITQAGNAAGSAERANTASGQAETNSDRAKTVADQASKVATGARIEADSFEKDIVSAKDQAARAETDLQASLQRTTRLESELSWRTVTPEQTQKIKAFLNPFRFRLLSPLDGVKISFTYEAGNPEVAEYAVELKYALSTALEGFTPQIAEPSSMLGVGETRPTEGLIMSVSDPKNPAAVAIQQALNAGGIVAHGNVNRSIGTDSIVFFVGVKPHPPKGSGPNL